MANDWFSPEDLHKLTQSLGLSGVSPIERGWSTDRKYRVLQPDGRPALLRLSPANQQARKQASYHIARTAAAIGVPMCTPAGFGVWSHGVYSLHSWIDGEDAEAVVPGMSKEDQYALGTQAGQVLRKLHTLPAPADTPDWAARFNQKIDSKIAAYLACPLRYEGGAFLLSYLQANRSLLDGRPQTYQHGDYHIGNMMIDTQGQLVIIDFDRDDYGDPWEEFNRIVWCADSAPAFASGMVDGYFDGSIPPAFWLLLMLYIASNTISALPWAIPFGQAEVDTMTRQSADVLRWYDNMRRPVPGWYRAGGG